MQAVCRCKIVNAKRMLSEKTCKASTSVALIRLEYPASVMSDANATPNVESWDGCSERKRVGKVGDGRIEGGSKTYHVI